MSLERAKVSTVIVCEELSNASIEERKDDERVVILIPKREIETWIHFLLGNAVNESDSFDTRYKGKLPPREFCEPSAQALRKLVLSPASEDLSSIPSLEVGLIELQCLDK